MTKSLTVTLVAPALNVRPPLWLIEPASVSAFTLPSVIGKAIAPSVTAVAGAAGATDTPSPVSAWAASRVERQRRAAAREGQLARPHADARGADA